MKSFSWLIVRDIVLLKTQAVHLLHSYPQDFRPYPGERL